MSEGLAEPVFQIEGGADPQTAAAIAAAIAQLVAEEGAARSRPPRRPQQSNWVLAWRPRAVPPPLPAHVYDADRGWSEQWDAYERGTEPPRT